ncbi:hypothetical protein [Actinomycetospora sp.]|jgi:hypothetical protein|uniref:hypothetical protein n=1 Tax=Actinomycetospora sp. TaxID=1872135 RepID=UPI002F4166EE
MEIRTPLALVSMIICLAEKRAAWRGTRRQGQESGLVVLACEGRAGCGDLNFVSASLLILGRVAHELAIMEIRRVRACTIP